jgi:hypothetical protein
MRLCKLCHPSSAFALTAMRAAMTQKKQEHVSSATSLTQPQHRQQNVAVAIYSLVTDINDRGTCPNGNYGTDDEFENEQTLYLKKLVTILWDYLSALEALQPL